LGGHSDKVLTKSYFFSEESPPLSGHGLANTSQITWQSVPQTSLYPSSEVKCYWEKLTAKLYDHSSRTARIIGNIEVDLFVFRESGEVNHHDISGGAGGGVPS